MKHRSIRSLIHNYRSLTFLIALFVLAAAQIATAEEQTASRSYAGDNLLLPTFVLRDGTKHCAGIAWCAKTNNGKSVVVTALHLMGPDGGQPRTVPASKVASTLARVDLLTMSTQKSSSTNKVLSKTGYLMRGQSESDFDFSGDVMFFQAPPNVIAKPFAVATSPAKAKDPVWLFTQVADGSSSPQLYPAVVVDSNPKMLEIKLSKPLALRATSGSPVLDKQGKVVGLLVSGVEEQGLVFCNPGSSINSHIQKDLK